MLSTFRRAAGYAAAALVALSVLSPCDGAEETSDDRSAREARKLRVAYQFARWPGRRLPAKPGISGAQIAAAVAKATAKGKAAIEIDEPLRLRSSGQGTLTRRVYNVPQPPLLVTVVCGEDPSAVQEHLIGLLCEPCAAYTADERVRLAVPPSKAVGTLCYIGHPGAQLSFIRNNILVLLRSDPSLVSRESFLSIAKALDAVLVSGGDTGKAAREASSWLQKARLSDKATTVGKRVSLVAPTAPAGLSVMAVPVDDDAGQFLRRAARLEYHPLVAGSHRLIVALVDPDRGHIAGHREYTLEARRRRKE